MWFKKFTVVLSLLLLMVAGKNSFALENPQPVLEGPFLQVYIGKDLNGYITTRDCDKCKTYRAKITPDVKVLVDGKAGNLSDFVLTNKKPVYVVYDKKSRKALIIGWR